MKRLYLISGPENSGTKFCSTVIGNQKGVILARANQDQTDLDAFFDYIEMKNLTKAKQELEFKAPGERFTARRSIPHDQRMPDLKTIIEKQKYFGIYTRLIITVRDPEIVARGQVRRGHSKTKAEAYAKIQQAYQYLLMLQCEKYFFHYEAAIAMPDLYIPYFLRKISINMTNKIIVKNENLKYFRDEK